MDQAVENAIVAKVTAPAVDAQSARADRAGELPRSSAAAETGEVRPMRREVRVVVDLKKCMVFLGGMRNVD